MKKVILILTLLTVSLSLYARDIKGRIVDEQEVPMESASVVLLNADSTFVSSTVTDKNGDFSITDDGKYITISYIGYNQKTIMIDSEDLGTIHLLPDAAMLEEVTVTASPIVHTSVGYRMRVSVSPLVKGKDTTRLLEFLPNISQEDGIIKINGLTATEITIDGRKIYSIDELKEIPAEYIETIDVRYIAKASQITESAGGTIDIRLKPAPQMGFYGMLHGSTDTEFKKKCDDGYLYGSVSARLRKLSIYEALSGGITRVRESYDYVTESSSETTRLHMLEPITHHDMRNTLAVGYDVTEWHSINLNWNMGWRKSDISDGDAATGALDMHSVGRTISNTLSFNYAGRLSRRGDRLSFSAEWLKRRSRQNQNLYDEGIHYSNPNNKDLSDSYRLTVDWECPIGGTHTLNAGVSYDAVDLRATQWDNLKDGGIVDVQSIKTHTPMPYVSAQGNFGKIGYYGGLNWQSNILYVDDVKARVRSCLNPTVQFTVPLDKYNRYGLTVMYKHTLQSIPYDAISNKEVWEDANTYSIGNPDLKAPAEDYVSIMSRILGGKFNLSANLSRVTDQIIWQTFSDPRFISVTYTKPINLSRPYLNYSLRAEYTQQLFGFWTLKGSAYVGFRKENAELSGVRYNKTRLRQSYSLSNSFDFGKGWGGYAKAYLEPKFRSLDRTYHKVWNMNCRVYKSFLKDDLFVWIDFQPCGKRRRLDRMSADRKVSMTYTTPVQHLSLSIQYYFRGGKKDINVDTGRTTIGYDEIKDAR